MSKISGIVVTALTAMIFINGTFTLPVNATDWESGFPIHVVFEELEGSHYGEVDVTLTMYLPAGTPLLARETAVTSTFNALQDIWNIQTVHENVRSLLGPVVPVEVQNAVSHISGTAFVLELIDAFETVSDAGFSRFQTDTEISVTERVIVPRRGSVDMYPDTPRFFAWIVGEGWPEDERNTENWVIASMINYSAAVLSFRSEVGRFPTGLAELNETGHMLIEPLNPYSGEPVLSVNLVNPGDITYEVIDTDNVVLMTYLRVGSQTEVIRREINVPSASSYDLLYRQTAGMTELDRQVARYTFQIAQILNEYYYQYSDLPYRVPQCEMEGFAYVSFENPYTAVDTQMASNFSPQAGDYFYQRISSSEYLLLGYGATGAGILTITKNFLVPQIEMGSLQSR